ncbi:ABC transporter permease [Phaeovulum vinaykumarii]|uniref:Putative hydroxymethylpyrimidine transport system permease protein n=1 Tax=Phaeovulum vinaykumarii TaxID=407234 RepID=A0A1N7LL18_9RHOB|nr:ABC transporter permease [Phaeovulum vinaykumarii]SIS74545.1 putative hydroxymethylpyrimidine transport system permease protein [Phaeovulum vinaykumarii]SOC05093.1 putative hydroxymethylpyrimidine transport system permease protein [Phaeovulum vinaykumarii]
MIRVPPALIAAALGLGLWQGVVWLAAPPPFILPSPARVAHVGWENRSLLIEHAGVTLSEVLLGLSLGIVIGALAAIMLARSERLGSVIMPMLVLTQAVPVFALAPILTLWAGYGMVSKVLMAALIIFFPVLSAFHDGLTRMPPGLSDLSTVMNARPAQALLRLRIPHALPSLAVGVKMAFVYAPIGAVIGEWVGASRGLGYLMLLANGRAKTDLMFACLAVLAISTVALYRLASWCLDRLVWEDG